MVACLLYLRSSSAAPLLSLCTKLEPNSMQIRTGSAILSTLVRVWFEFASSLQRIYSGGTAEDEQRYSRLTSDLLLTYGREKSRYFITNPEKKISRHIPIHGTAGISFGFIRGIVSVSNLYQHLGGRIHPL